MDEIKKILKKLPVSPGIYKMLDKNDKIIYIGKAKDLSKRVRQYFQKNYQHSTRTKKLVEKITNIEWIAVDSELEAIMLETNLIKEFLPKYNVIMKDDKNYVYIKITNEEFPQIQIVRKILKDGAKYIGPKSAAGKVKETFKVIKKVFPFRHCNLDIEFLEKGKEKHKVKVTKKTIKYPCLDYHIKRCIAPCIGKCTPEEYKNIIKNVENFLNGKADDILKNLNKEMQGYAKNRNFEKAAKMRDKIQKIQNILEKQKVSDPNQEDKDIINYVITHERAYFNLFQIRDGKLLGQENFILSAKDREHTEDPEVLEAFIKQYYKIATDIPKEILISHKIENSKEIKEWLKNEAKKTVKLVVPQKGTKNKLLEMSLKNARIYADRNKPSWQEESKLTKAATENLQKILKLKNPLKRIECYDISHLSGTDTVGSMVVFEKGVPKNAMYRKFRLRTVQNKPDDYKSMEEILTRRFTKIAKDVHQKNYTFKKAIKKYDAEIKKESKKIKVDKPKDSYKDFYMLEKLSPKGKKSLAGFGKITEVTPKISFIQSLTILKKEQGKHLGHKILKGLIAKAKSKRVYLICFEKLRDYYLTLGFEEIKKVPKELEKHYKKCKKGSCKTNKPIALAFDKNKHKPDESFTKIPDLVIIDGGKGQLSAATKIFKDLNLKIPYLSLAKKLEQIHLPNKKLPIQLERTSNALKLLQRARDEAHRFAISYNKQLRSKKYKF